MKGFIKLIIVIAVLGGIWFAWEQWKGNEAIQVDYQTEPLEKGDLMITIDATGVTEPDDCLLYTSPSPRDKRQPRMPSSA